MSWEDQNPGAIADLVNEEIAPKYDLGRNINRADEEAIYDGQVDLDADFWRETGKLLEHLFDEVIPGGSHSRTEPYRNELGFIVKDGDETYQVKVSSFETGTGDMERALEVYDSEIEEIPWTV